MYITQFLNMDGYGIYVWPAYCITLLIFVINIALTLQEKRQIKKIISQYLAQINVKTHES